MVLLNGLHVVNNVRVYDYGNITSPDVQVYMSGQGSRDCEYVQPMSSDVG